MPDLIQAALRSHPTLTARQSEIRAAQAGVASARWQYWPTPSVSMERSERASTAGSDRQVGVFSLKQPLWTAGRLDAGIAQAQAAQAGSEAALTEGQRDVALEVVVAYGEAYAAQSRVAAYEQSLGVHERLLAQVQRRANEGLSAPSDVQLANSRRGAVLAERAYAAAQRDTARQRLQSLVGHAVSGDLGDPVLPVGLTTPGQTTVEAAMNQDPTLARLRTDIEQLEARARQSQAALWPEVFARVDHRRADATGNTTQLFIGLESRWGAGLSTAAATEATLHQVEAKHSEIDARQRKLGEQILSDQQLLDAAALCRFVWNAPASFR
ncbi:TolC family protein [Aquabacterium sp.]|uniref:TolC family protein n=1 Tax=Aquabacterium sp. TaxID=1872578 RepID=UPI003CFD3F9E